RRPTARTLFQSWGRTAGAADSVTAPVADAMCVRDGAELHPRCRTSALSLVLTSQLWHGARVRTVVCLHRGGWSTVVDDEQMRSALEAWRKRLIDLTRRNQLIKFKPQQRSVLRLIDP